MESRCNIRIVLGSLLAYCCQSLLFFPVRCEMPRCSQIWTLKWRLVLYSGYIQVDSVAMGSPLGPILGKIFLSQHGENWLNKCPIKFTSSFYRRYVDGIFVLFESPESVHLFREYMSSKHQNINFTVTGKYWLTFVFRRQNLS